MSKTKNKYSVSKAIRKNEKGRVMEVIYLSTRDEENGIDIQLDMDGWEVTSL